VCLFCFRLPMYAVREKDTERKNGRSVIRGKARMNDGKEERGGKEKGGEEESGKGDVRKEGSENRGFNPM